MLKALWALVDNLVTQRQAIKQLGETLIRIEGKVGKIMATLDETLAEVTAERTQIDSLSTLTSGIKKQLDDILAGQLPADVQAKVDALFRGVEANKQAVVDAINANTPAPPTA